MDRELRKIIFTTVLGFDGAESGFTEQLTDELEIKLKKAIYDLTEELIEKDEPVPAMDRSVAYNWKRIEAEERNKLRSEQRSRRDKLI